MHIFRNMMKYDELLTGLHAHILVIKGYNNYCPLLSILYRGVMSH